MTAVEWLEKQLLSHTKIENSKYIQQNIVDIPVWQLNKYLEQAKEMEKDRIEEAWNDGNYHGRNGDRIADYNTGKQYYNDTYSK